MVNGCGCFIERGCMGQALAHLVWGVCLDVGPDCFLLHIKLPPYPSFFCPGPPLPSCPRSDLAQAGQPGAPAAHQVLQPPHAPEEAQTAGSRLRAQVQQAGLQVRGASPGRPFSPSTTVSPKPGPLDPRHYYLYPLCQISGACTPALPPPLPQAQVLGGPRPPHGARLPRQGGRAPAAAPPRRNTGSARQGRGPGATSTLEAVHTSATHTLDAVHTMRSGTRRYVHTRRASFVRHGLGGGR